MKQANEAGATALNTRPFILAGPRHADAIAFAVQYSAENKNVYWDIGCVDCLAEFDDEIYRGENVISAEWIRDWNQFDGCAFCGKDS